MRGFSNWFDDKHKRFGVMNVESGTVCPRVCVPSKLDINIKLKFTYIKEFFYFILLKIDIKLHHTVYFGLVCWLRYNSIFLLFHFV